MAKVNIAGIDKATLLAAIYNGAGSPRGMGMYQARAGKMTREVAEDIIKQGDDTGRMFPGSRESGSLYFDYVFGKSLKVDLSGDEMDSWLYNRDNGQDALENIVAALRK
jgi:hypothetical protein